MSTALIKPEIAAEIERVVVSGDLSKLDAGQRLSYYKAICESVGLNPLTKPFEYITLNGKLTLYARKDCTDQLRSIHSVSVTIQAREVVDDCYVVTARSTMPNGRTDESIGAVSISNLKGEAKANAMMKAETKAKRRVTLSICGLGMLDESEIETIPSAKPPEPPRSNEVRTFGRPNGAGVDENKGPSAPAPESEPVIDVLNADTIDAGQAANFHKLFRDSLKPALRKNADELAHDFLRAEKILDILGKPSALAIRKDSFYDVRDKAVAHAKSL